MLTFAMFFVGLMLLLGGLASKIDEMRRAELYTKYRDWDVVDWIMKQQCWIGQTEAQLKDAKGPPIDTNYKTSKSKTVKVWKYEQTGKNRFQLRVTLHDGVVAVIDQK